jgi:hypothetical protein
MYQTGAFWRYFPCRSGHVPTATLAFLPPLRIRLVYPGRQRGPMPDELDRKIAERVAFSAIWPPPADTR